MRPINKLVLIFFAGFLFSNQALADSETPAGAHTHPSIVKLQSGIANIATGWLEIPKNINLVGQQPNTPASGAAAIGLGTLQGGWYTINRMGCGILDLITAIVPTKPSVDPVFVWDDFSRETKFMGY